MTHPQTTPDNSINLLEDAMMFIRRRHNYRPKRRAEERMKLLKRFTHIEQNIARERWKDIANGRD